MDKKLKPVLSFLFCFSLFTQATAGTEIPDSLKTTQSSDKLNINSDAENGCAFAGVWNVTGGRYGPRPYVITVNGNTLRAGYEEKKFKFRKIGIVTAQIDPSGRSASGRWVELDDEGTFELTIHSNGLGFDATSKFSSYKRYDYKGQKIQTLICNKPNDFVEKAFVLRKGGPWKKNHLRTQARKQLKDQSQQCIQSLDRIKEYEVIISQLDVSDAYHRKAHNLYKQGIQENKNYYSNNCR